MSRSQARFSSLGSEPKASSASLSSLCNVRDLRCKLTTCVHQRLTSSSAAPSRAGQSDGWVMLARPGRAPRQDHAPMIAARSSAGRQRVARRGVQDRAPQPVAIGVAELELGQVLGVGFQQPGMVDDRQQDQRLARRQRVARTAHDLSSPQAARSAARAPPRGAGLRLPLPSLPCQRDSFAEPPRSQRCAPALARAPAGANRRAHALVEILPVIFPHRRIGDRVGHFGDALVEPGAPFGRVEAAGLRSRAATACRRAGAPRRSPRRSPRARRSARDRPGPAPPAAART